LKSTSIASTLAIEVIHDVEGAKAMSTPQRIAYEVRRPTLIHLLIQRTAAPDFCLDVAACLCVGCSIQAAINAVYAFVIPVITNGRMRLSNFGNLAGNEASRGL
jgi:hypothetical protein